jgi:hypothetical protein
MATAHKETDQILDLLHEWAKQDCPSVEWLPSRVEKVIEAALEARMASAKDACLNLGAEIAMATNALPERRIKGLMAAFHNLEELVK